MHFEEFAFPKRPPPQKKNLTKVGVCRRTPVKTIDGTCSSNMTIADICWLVYSRSTLHVGRFFHAADSRRTYKMFVF